MIKIRALRPSELKQVLSLLSRYSDQDSEYSVLQIMRQLYVPLHRLSQLLPLNFQFMPGIFVAVSRGQVLGMIWLSRDGRHSRRWKIDHLILDPSAFSYDLGTQLVNYVINRLGGEGVQTFLAYVDQYYNTGLALLKSCGFRRCTRMHYFTCPDGSALTLEKIKLEGLRESSRQDGEKLATLYNDYLPPETRMCLGKSAHDFNRSWPVQIGGKLRGLFLKRWVMEDVARDSLIASIEISTRNYQEFSVTIIVNAGWDDLYINALSFAVQQMLLVTANPEFQIDCPEFRKTDLQTLETLGLKRTGIAEVLIKDYWIPLEDRGNRLTSPILLFTGRTSPAVNIQ